MITVKRKVYPNGAYSCTYYHGGREIAKLSHGGQIAKRIGSDDCLWLRTEYIGSDFDRTAYNRAITCRIGEAYRQLFDMLGIDESSYISEYMYA